MLYSLAAIFLAGAPLAASSLKMEFVPTNSTSWQTFLVVDRLAGSAFPKLSWEVTPTVPADLENVPEDRKAEIKIHLWIYRQSPELYLRYLRLASLAPGALPWEQVAGLLGVNLEQAAKAIDGDQGIALIKGAARSQSKDGKLSVGNATIPMELNLPTLAQSINKNLPPAEQVVFPERILEAAKKPKVELVVINADDQVDWAKIDQGVLDNLKNLNFDLTARTLKSKNPEAQAILKDTGIDLVPVVIFRPQDDSSRKILDDYAARGAVDQRGANNDFYIARSFTSSGLFWKKGENKEKELQLFIMSQCPYGVAAQKTLLEIEKSGKMPKGIKTSYRFIVDKTVQEGGKPGFRSLHGSGELEENVRQMVIQKHEPGKLNCYLTKRLADVNSSFWNEALESCGIDTANFKKLYETEHDSLLEADAKLSDSLSINSSPTFLWKGKYILGGLAGLKNIDEFKDIDFAGLSATTSAPAGKCQ